MNSGTNVVGVPAMAPAAAHWVVVIVGCGARGTGCKKNWLVGVSELPRTYFGGNYDRPTRCRRGRCMVKKLRKGCWTASPRTVSQQKRGVYGVAEDYKRWGEMRCFLENARRLGRKCTSLDKQTR